MGDPVAKLRRSHTSAMATTLPAVAKAPKPPSPESDLPLFLVKKVANGPNSYAVEYRLTSERIGPTVTALRASELAESLNRKERIQRNLDAERHRLLESTA